MINVRKFDRFESMRYTLFALLALSICSCRAPYNRGANAPQRNFSGGGSMMPGQFGQSEQAFGPGMQGPANTLPPTAFTGHSEDGYTVPGALPGYAESMAGPSVPVAGPPLPLQSYGPWKPPGIAGPWPEDEFVFDGGDQNGVVRVRDDWRVDGLDLEDTVAHYDTLDGRTLVEPSNRVCLYAPRFAAVRRVDGLQEGAQIAKAGGAVQPIGLVRFEDQQRTTTALQPLQPLGQSGARPPIIVQENQLAAGQQNNVLPFAVTDRLKAYENFAVIRTGLIEESEKAFLAKSVQAAIQWTRDQAVQVVIEGRRAQADTGTKQAQVEYRVDLPGNPKLRVCKVASAPNALPGEEIEFTLRFDNVGNQTIGNVTLMDSLTTRLEYVPNTAQASVPANFSVEPNQGESLVLRWEILDPIKAGDGGLVRFKCKVR